MRRFGTISLMFVGFVAGIIFVYSCGGGGGSIVLAEITDITGLEAGLDAINSSIQGIDAKTDTTGIESVLNTVASAIGGVTLSTDMSGVITELQNIDTTLQNLKFQPDAPTLVSHAIGWGAALTFDLFVVPPGQKFVLTDVSITGGSQNSLASFQLLVGTEPQYFSPQVGQTYDWTSGGVHRDSFFNSRDSFRSGIVFIANETISVGTTGVGSANISGYLSPAI